MTFVGMYASDLDAASRAQLARGARLVEVLKQPQASPYPVEKEVVAVWAGTTGQLDDVDVADVRRFESEFLDFVGREHDGIFSTIRETGKLEDDTEKSLEEAVSAFKKQFKAGQNESLVGTPTDDPVEAHEDDDVDREKIVRRT